MKTASLNEHCWLVIILIAFIALGVLYSIVTPIFEAGDELWHYPFVQSLATGRGLPIQDPNVETLWAQEGGQPPLYYTISALATFWIDTRDLSDRLWRNPHARIGIPLDFGNKNLVVHTSAENFPWQNTTLAVHLIRFLSILLSAITVALTYFFALEIKNDKTIAAIAAAIVAFNPMFIFISASVNNDNLATMLATLSLLILAQIITRGATMRRFTGLGVVLGLGALTKVSNAGLFVVAAMVFAYLLWKDWKRRQETIPHISVSSHLLGGIFICAFIVIAIAFWWYVRNWLLYNDPLAFNVWVQISGGRPTPATLATLFDEFQGFRISFWGNFGGVNLIAPGWVYTLLDAFTLVALVGLLVGWLRRTLPRLLWLPSVWLVIIAISLVRWTWLTMASQGRLIFPAIAAVAVLLAYGLTQYKFPNSKSQFPNLNFGFGILNLSFAFCLLTFSLLAPFTFIAPAYALPVRFANDASVPNPIHLTFDHQAELVGYDLPQKSVAPGGELPITLYWRARERIGEDFSVSIVLFDASNQIVARWNAFPGEGLYPTRLWQPGEIIEDKYRIPVSLDARGPSVGRVQVSLFRRVPLENLTAFDPDGRAVTPTIARFKITGQSQVKIQNSVNYNFANQIALVGYDAPKQISPGGAMSVKLNWRALTSMTDDYTVFVHLVDANGNIIAQKDDQPQSGTYPTSFWDVGETIADEYVLAIPRDTAPGDYKIEIGVYRASDGTRLDIEGIGDHLTLAAVHSP